MSLGSLKGMGGLTRSLFAGNSLEDFMTGATVVSHERADPTFEEQKKIAEAIGKERGETLAEKSGSIEEVEINATKNLVEEGFVPYSHKKDWNLRDAEEKFHIVHPLVQLVHDKILEMQPYPVEKFDDAIPSKPVKSRGRKLLYLGIAAVLGTIGLGAYYINDQNQKREQRINQLATVMPRSKGMGFDDKFQKYAVNNIFNQTLLNGGRVYNIDPSLLDHGLQVYGSFAKIPSVNLAGINSTQLAEIHRNSLQDPRKNTDANTQTEETAQLCLDLNLAGKSLGTPTIRGLGNLSIAYRSGLPKFDKIGEWLFTNASQLSGDIVDFSPIRFNSSDDNDVYIVPIPSRETYITAKQLQSIKESGFDIEKHPEMFMGLNGKIITDAWCIFDNPGGINSVEKNLTPSDSRVSDLMMLQWQLDSQFTPQFNGTSKPYNRDFPWYNSTELVRTYTDANERIDKNGIRVDLFNKFYLAPVTYSIKDQKIVTGIEGATIDLQQASSEYKTIAALYPNGTVIGHYDNQSHDVRFYFEDWLLDRSHNGLLNTVAQYKIFEESLVKNWKYGDFVKFIAGYERWNSRIPELEGIEYVIPSVLRMAGFPTIHINIEPTPSGAPNREWAINLPPFIVEKLYQEFPNAKVLFGPGYSFGLYSCEDGLLDDGIKKVLIMLGNKTVYLMKKD